MSRTRGSSGSKTISAIQLAGQHLFAQRGFRCVSLRDIGKEVGLSPSVTYIYFPSKNSILYVILEEYFRSFQSEIAEAVSRARDPLERLSAYVNTYVDFNLTEIEQFIIAMFDVKMLKEAELFPIRKRRECLEGMLREILLGVIRDVGCAVFDPNLMAMSINDALSGVVLSSRLLNDMERAAIIETCQRLIMNSVVAGGVHPGHDGPFPENERP